MAAVKILTVVGLAAAVMGAGIVIATRLSDEAIMTIVGVFCGIMVSIPCSIGLLIALTREHSAYIESESETPHFVMRPTTATYRTIIPPKPTPADYWMIIRPPQSALPAGIDGTIIKDDYVEE